MIINIKLKHPLCGVDFLQHAYKQPQQVSHLSLTFCCHKKFFYPKQIIRFFLDCEMAKGSCMCGAIAYEYTGAFSRYVSFAVYLDCVL